jgi:hypothetical protein
MFTDAYWPRINGVTVSVDTYSHALIRAGHQVVIVCSSYPELAGVKHMASIKDREASEPRIIQVPSVPSLISKEDRLAKLDKL